ncbi:MAG: hypothetical protein L0209_01120 [candidate division Zixibacteria bacterium]|nr:hypothetical protein [candidate division Zixibacteria bacterium]
MDTALVPGNSPPIAVHWVMHPLNESTWVATCRPSSYPSEIGWSYTTDRGKSWTAVAILPIYSPWFNSTDITGADNTIYVVSHADPNDPGAFITTERPCYLKGTYNPTTGALNWGTIQDITGPFEQPNYLSNMLGISALMIEDTLHLIWTDWNNWKSQTTYPPQGAGFGFDGPGGHVHHAAVLPDGTIQGPHKIADINVDGRLPDRSSSLFGFMYNNWPNVSLSYNPTSGVLYGLWSQPPDNGNFGWADYEQFGILACYDIFCSASPSNGRYWDSPQNVTQTNNSGCDGTPGDPCHHEDWFSTAELADSVVNVVAMVQRYPGIASFGCDGCTPDPGPLTELYDVFRLYRVPARTPVPSLRADLGLIPGDTLLRHLDEIVLRPRGGIFNVNLLLSNLGTAGFFPDSVRLTGNLNDGYLVTTISDLFPSFIPAGGSRDFLLTFNTDGVGPGDQGVRSGSLLAYVRTTDPAVPPGEREKVLELPLTVYVVTNLCLNRKMQIHSASNRTDIGTQGTIKDQSGYGMNYEVNGHDNFYDGGVWIANSALSAPACASGPRKVSRQLFGDKFLRCVADGILDSTTGNGYVNVSLKSIGTDVNDTTLVWQNIWEQSTQFDSSDFLIQTTRVINIGSAPIDSVAMGAIYDVDVQVDGVVSAGENVGGDTILSHLGRAWWFGWIGSNDGWLDSCLPGPFAYGFVVVPGSIGNPGDTVRPRGAVVYRQDGFSYNIGCQNATGGDSLLQRYAWNLDEQVSTRDRSHDSLTGTWRDTTGGCQATNKCAICGGPGAYGTGYRDELGYMAVAKKVYNLPVNGGGQNVVARYGLDGLAASIDTFFTGPGETYTIIHVATSGGGMSELFANAVRGIDWYVNHSASHVGPVQTWRKGDLDNNGALNPADVVAELLYTFSGVDTVANQAIPLCAADLNNTGDISPADAVLLLNGVFAGAGCPNCLRPCI